MVVDHKRPLDIIGRGQDNFSGPGILSDLSSKKSKPIKGKKEKYHGTGPVCIYYREIVENSDIT